MAFVPSIVIVIPAYKPSDRLIDLVESLAGRMIVIVDDGSGPKFAPLFSHVGALPNVRLLRHAVNLGKGAALKTAMNYVLCEMPDAQAIVTADADGQHHPEDIAKVVDATLSRSGALVLGSRAFDKDVPLRSRFGNVLTRGIMHALLGRKLTDTQTGLRGIPATLLPRLLRLESTGYEFELEMLLAAHNLSIPIVEVPIRTIYEPGNKSSHFNPVIDSMKIYFVLLRFGSVSMLTALLDNVVFIVAYHWIGSILASQIIGRAVAVTFNYTMVRRSVFDSHQRHATVLPKYLLLVVVSGSASYAGIRFLNENLGVNPVPAKLLVETALFFVNFAVQRVLIFKPQESGRA
jgi:glycosyltransferase involved in cell wall biosynthesis